MIDLICLPAQGTIIADKEVISKPSMCCQMTAMIARPFSMLGNVIGRLAWRLVDPNWEAFKVESLGHFAAEKHKDTFDNALLNADKIFGAVIEKEDAPKEWHAVHERKQQERVTGKVWNQFSTRYKGTCFGNCVSLANNILKAKRPLTVVELRDIEHTKKFINTAQTVQCIANLSSEYNSDIVANGISKIHTDQETGLQALGLSAEDYEESPYKRKIDMLITIGVQKSDLGDTSVESLLGLNPLAFGMRLGSIKDGILKKNMIKPGLEMMKQFEFIASDTFGDVTSMPSEKFQEKMISDSKLIDPQYTGIMLLNGISANAATGHAMFMEIDNKSKTYILYDNNRGYYQWSDLKSCISAVQKRLVHEKYTSCEVLLGNIETESL